MYSTQLGRRISSLHPLRGMRNNVLKNCHFPTHARLVMVVALCRTHFQLNLRGKCWNCCLAVIRAQSWRGMGADGTLETARRTIRMVVVATPLLRRNQENENTRYNWPCFYLLEAQEWCLLVWWEIRITSTSVQVPQCSTLCCFNVSQLHASKKIIAL